MKNKLKKLIGVLLICLVTISAAAYLTTKSVATKPNVIRPGTIKVVFDNEAEEINITDVMPMTKDYAATNMPYHTFTIDNDGTMAVDYAISISNDSYKNEFLNNALKVAIAEIDTTEEANVREALKDADVFDVKTENVINVVDGFEAGASKQYAIMAYLDGDAVNSEVLPSLSATFKLELTAAQESVASGQYVLASKVDFSSLVGDAVTLEFTDEAVVEGATTTDLSQDKDSSVLGYTNGDTYTVTTATTGQNVIAQKNMSKAFSNLSNVTTIDASKLDMSNTTNVEGLTEGSDNLTTIKVADETTKELIEGETNATVEAENTETTEKYSLSLETANINSLTNMTSVNVINSNSIDSFSIPFSEFPFLTSDEDFSDYDVSVMLTRWNETTQEYKYLYLTGELYDESYRESSDLVVNISASNKKINVSVSGNYNFDLTGANEYSLDITMTRKGASYDVALLTTAGGYNTTYRRFFLNNESAKTIPFASSGYGLLNSVAPASTYNIVYDKKLDYDENFGLFIAGGYTTFDKVANAEFLQGVVAIKPTDKIYGIKITKEVHSQTEKDGYNHANYTTTDYNNNKITINYYYKEETLLDGFSISLNNSDITYDYSTGLFSSEILLEDINTITINSPEMVENINEVNTNTDLQNVEYKVTFITTK